MMVAGVVKSMTGESAQRAALGAGSIVMDILASNDKRLFHEKVVSKKVTRDTSNSKWTHSLQIFFPRRITSPNAPF